MVDGGESSGQVRVRRAVLAVIGAVATAVGSVGPALADSTVVVHGLDFPTGWAAQLSFVGCEAPYDRTDETLQPYIGVGPGDHAPAGERSLGYDLSGGNAIGSLHYVSSMRTTTVASLSVYAEHGASGVAYAGYQAPADRGTMRVWFGRAELSAPSDSWTSVSTAGLSYTWTQYDMGTKEETSGPAGTATIGRFIRTHGGDGPGFFTIGFGCDGNPFNMDRWRIGSPGAVTTYDLEGLTTTTTITGSEATIESGQAVTIRGSVVDGTGADLPDTRLVLEADDGSGWKVVKTVEGADPRVTVKPEATTTYRWHFVDRPLAEGSYSDPFTVHVRPAASETPDPSLTASAAPTAEATTAAPTASPTGQSTASARTGETAKASAKTSTKTATKTAAQPTRTATPTASPTPTVTISASTSSTLSPTSSPTDSASGE